VLRKAVRAYRGTCCQDVWDQVMDCARRIRSAAKHTLKWGPASDSKDKNTRKSAACGRPGMPPTPVWLDAWRRSVHSAQSSSDCWLAYVL
jgi:hypothetical protein